MQSASLSLSVVRGVNRAIRSHLATLHVSRNRGRRLTFTAQHPRDGQGGPCDARRGSGLGYAYGVEAEVCRMGASVTYIKAALGPADGKKSPSPGCPTSLGAVAVAGQAEPAAAKEREHWEGVRKKAMLPQRRERKT